MFNVLSQLIHLALAYVWLVLCLKATKHKKETELAGGSMTERTTSGIPLLSCTQYLLNSKLEMTLKTCSAN